MRLLPLIATMASTIALAACDSQARLSPDFMKLPAPPPPAAELAPDVRTMVRENLSSMFLAQSAPKNVAVSAPVRVRDSWTACLRATVTGISGARTGAQTFVLTIKGGKIIQRDRVDRTHPCATETYEPV